MELDEKKLIEKFGSWVRVQVAFYDFIFQSAMSMCPEHTTEMMVKGFADGDNPYEDCVKVIEKKFPTPMVAWIEFVHHHSHG